MRPVSDRFLETLRGSHKRVSEVYALLEDAPGQPMVWRTGTDPELWGDFITTPGRVSVPLLFTTGTVELDASSAVRATLSLDVPVAYNPDLANYWPEDPDGRLAPFGQELFVRTGVEFAPGDIEWVGLGFFRIMEIEQDNAPMGSIHIEAQDRMSAIVESRMLYPRQFARTTTLGGFFSDLVGEVFPNSSPDTPIWEFDDAALNSRPINRTVIVEEDRYKALEEVATAFGKVLFFDQRGILVMTDPPNEFLPVETLKSGANGNIMQMGRRINRERFYNAVVAYGEGTDDDVPPARAAVVDADPNSPTYFYGRFGQVPRYYSSPVITTDAQARSAATSLLSKYSGLPRSIDLRIAPNPALEPHDPILVEYEGVATIHTIEYIAIELTNFGETRIETRERRTLLEEAA